MQRGQSTLEWVIGAAVILGTLATQWDHPSNHGAAIQLRALASLTDDLNSDWNL